MKNEIKKEKISPIILLIMAICAIIIVVVCAFLRHKYIALFLNVGTVNWSAIKIFSGIAHQKIMLIQILKYLFKQFFLGYILSSLPLLISIFLILFILKQVSMIEKFISTTQKWLVENKKTLLIIGAIIAVVLMLLVNFIYMAGRPVSTDEFAYYFQGDLLKSFRLYVGESDHPEFYQCENIVFKDGKWYGKYTIGFPLFLAIGLLIRFPWIVNPLISIATLAFIFLITRLLFNEKAAFLSVFIAIFSPFFFFNGAAAFQPHMSLAFTLLGSAYFYFRTVEDCKLQYPVLTAIFFTLGTLVRPVDAAIWGVSFFLLSIYFLVTRKDRWVLLKRFIIILIASVAGVFVILSINRAQTGEYLKFAFHSYQGNEVWGMSAYGHNIFKGTWNIAYSLTRMMAWSIPLFLEFALLSFLCKSRKRSIFLWLIFLFFIAFFFGWYALGHFEYGPRYLFTGFVFLIPASAAGLSWFLDRLNEKLRLKVSSVFSYVFVLSVFCITCVFPLFFPVFKAQVHENTWVKFFKTTERMQRESGKKIVVFIANAADNKVNSGTRNLYPMNSNPVVYMLFLEPEKDWDVIKEKYPDRIPYITFFDPGKRIFTFERFSELDSIDPESMSRYYLFAGLTYRFGVEDSKAAERVWNESFRLNNKNVGALINLGNMFMEDGDLDKSIPYWEKVIEIDPDMNFAYFFLGQVYQFKKDNEKAFKYYDKYLKRVKSGPDYEKAVERMMHYQKFGKFPD
ncbi:MAG: glycosyltransferase family 39 protein [Candidatus Eremiobacteraeota bacterium]|nr:glycosyltransferase family 39 protein [Candidatus Eremiobacteraeota bacterium]